MVGVLAACDGGGGSVSVSGDFVVEGSVAGAAPASGNAMVLWVSDVGAGDYLYKYGEGTSAGAAFAVGLDEPVPTAATFGGMFGVGQIALFGSSFTLADGEVTLPESTLSDEIVGFAGEYAIVFRGTTDLAPWLTQFPMGLSCGKCVHELEGFDSFTPVACDEIVIEVDLIEDTSTCNWT